MADGSFVATEVATVAVVAFTSADWDNEDDNDDNNYYNNYLKEERGRETQGSMFLCDLVSLTSH